MVDYICVIIYNMTETNKNEKNILSLGFLSSRFEQCFHVFRL